MRVVLKDKLIFPLIIVLTTLFLRELLRGKIVLPYTLLREPLEGKAILFFLVIFVIIMSRYSVKGKFILASLIFFAAIMSTRLLVNNPNMELDALGYLLPIHNFVAGKGYTYRGSPHIFYPPGYGVLSYIIFLFVKDIELSGMLASAFCYLLSIPTTYYIAKFLFDTRCAMLAAFFVTFCPTSLNYGYATLSDVSFSFFLLLSFYVYIKVLLDKNNVFKSILLGALLGFMYLIRPEGFIVAVFALFFLFVFSISSMRPLKLHNLSFVRLWKVFFHPALTLLAFLSLALPYILFLHHHTQTWTFTAKTSHVIRTAGKVSKGGDEHVRQLQKQQPEYSEFGHRFSIMSYIQERGWRFLDHIMLNIKNGLKVFRGITFHVLTPFGVTCIFLLFYPFKSLSLNINFDRWVKIASAYIAFISPLSAYLITEVGDRRVLPFALIIIIFFACVLCFLLEKISEGLGKNWFNRGMTVLAIVSVFSLSQSFSENALYSALRRGGENGFRDAGFWLRDHIQDLDTLAIISPRKTPVFLFYANGKKEPRGTPITATPEMTLEEIAKRIHTGEIDYLVLDKHYINTRPLLLPLWKNPDLAETYNLALIHHDSPGVFQIYGRK